MGDDSRSVRLRRALGVAGAAPRAGSSSAGASHQRDRTRQAAVKQRRYSRRSSPPSKRRHRAKTPRPRIPAETRRESPSARRSSSTRRSRIRAARAARAATIPRGHSRATTVRRWASRWEVAPTTSRSGTPLRSSISNTCADFTCTGKKTRRWSTPTADSSGTDGSTPIAELAKQPLLNPDEMNAQSAASIADKIKVEKYAPDFRREFGRGPG